MSKFFHNCALWLRWLADWCAPPLANDDRLAGIVALVAQADAFAEGTTGEFKRYWVYAKLCKLYPTEQKHILGSLLELAVATVKSR